MEDTGSGVKCAEKAPTNRDELVVATVRGVTGMQMVHGAGSCYKSGHAIQHNERTCHTLNLDFVEHGKVLKKKHYTC